MPLTGNPSYPTPALTVAAIVAAIHDLEAAETTALARTKGSIDVRNDKRKALIGLLQQVRALPPGGYNAVPPLKVRGARVSSGGSGLVPSPAAGAPPVQA